MSLQIADNFSYKGKKPLDARLVCNDIPDMLALPTSTIYDGIIVYVVAQKKFYTYDSNNTVDPTLQQWRELTTAGILIQSATIDNVTTSATKGHLILTMSDGTTIDCGDAKGDKGDKGDGFAIIKLYTNVSDMTSDTNPVNDGQMVAIIDSSTIPLIAKVYIRNSSQTQDASGNENGYTFFCNLADATVIQGPQGPQGPQGVKGDTPVVTTQAIAATSTTPSGTKITFTTGTGSTAVSTSINVYNGKDGISVQSATINASGELVFTLSDASTINVGKIGGNGTGGCITMLGCFDTAPTTFAQNDIYYNNLDGLIYKSPDGTTWGTGTQPEKDILYISMDDHKIYSYTNNTFEVYGGGIIDISSKSNNAIKNITGSINPTEDGLYVEDLSTIVNSISLSQKTVNSDLDYCFVGFWNTTNSNVIVTCARGAAIPFNTKFEGNLEFNSTNKAIKLKAGHRYKLHYQCKQIGTTANDNHMERFYNETTSEWLKMTCNCDTNDETHTMEEIYVPTVDCEVSVRNCWCPVTSFTMRVNCIDTDVTGPGLRKIDCESAFIVTEIGKTVTVDPVAYVDSTEGIEDTPVGHIMAVMGNKAPAHYLKADGSVYNIIDYPYLAGYFKDEFGASNYFGGDGTTTFAVPDLQGEFLRGTGTNSHDNQGSGASVGEHQDATEELDTAYSTKYNYKQMVGIRSEAEYETAKNVDSYIVNADSGFLNKKLDTLTSNPNNKVAYTARPTNTSVLYVIKYEPTYFMNLEGVEVTEDLLTNKLFDITTNGVTTIDKSFTLPTPITDFDEIETVYSYEKAEVIVKDSVSGTVATATELTPTSNYKGLNFPGTSTSGITYQTIPGLTYPLTVEIAFSTTSINKSIFVHDVKLGLTVGTLYGYLQLATANNTSIANMAYDISNWNLNDGNFHTITVTYNSANSANLYFDGVLKPSTTYSNTWDMSNISSIGNRFNYQYNGPYKGILYAVRFYNGILSQSDIVASYNSDKNYVLNNTAQIARNNLACEYKLYDSVEIMHSYTTSSKLSIRDIEYNSVLSVDKSVQNVTNNKAAYTELQYTFTDKNNVKFLNVSNHYNNYLPGSKFGIRRLTGIRKISK